MKNILARKTYNLIQDIVSNRVDALTDYEDDDYPYEDLLTDLDFKEIEPLLNAQFLGFGSHKQCFRKGRYVYSLFHNEDCERSAIFNEYLESSIWPKVKHISGLLYRMPFYKVYDYTSQLNSVQRHIYAVLKELSYDEPLSCDVDLPKYIINGLNELIEIGDHADDMRLDNIGWVGDRPVFFDAFYFLR